jgi:hypothetical protein
MVNKPESLEFRILDHIHLKRSWVGKQTVAFVVISVSYIKLRRVRINLLSFAIFRKNGHKRFRIHVNWVKFSFCTTRMVKSKKTQFLSCSFIFLFSVHISTIDKSNICAKIFLRMTPSFFSYSFVCSPILLNYNSTLITWLE